MSPLFRRRREDDGAVLPEPAAAALRTGPDGPERSDGGSRPQGPWDADDAPEDELERIDLGALRVPLVHPEQVEVGIQVEHDEPVGVSLQDGGTTVQLQVFAAPRSEGIWAEVRAEIAESLRGAGGTAEEVDGPFGRELAAQLPTEVPGRGVTLRPVRFVGVDGPRWFLRGLVDGDGATDTAARNRLDEVLRGTVVVRGKEAMVARDLLPLRLPREAMVAMHGEAAVAAAEAEQRSALDPFERGPEVTETR